MRIASIIVAGGARQVRCIWPTYSKREAGIQHDMIVVHRGDRHHTKESFECLSTEHGGLFNLSGGQIFLEDKCFSDGELPHKAFGAYRYYFQKYQDYYDYFAFISDDVYIKRDNWLKEACDMLNRHPRVGCVATQIFNGGSKYPHPSHARAPIWFARADALANIDWQFNSDHDGEMRIADQFLAAGYFSVQIGHKIDFAYDASQENHISVLWEHMRYGQNKLLYDESDINELEDYVMRRLENAEDDVDIQSPFGHIGTRKLISQVQPFHGLIYDKSIEIARKSVRVAEHNYGTCLWI